VEQRCGVIEEQRQVILDAGEGNAVANILVRQRTGWVAFECFPKAGAELVARGFVHGKLAPWKQLHFFDRIQAALGVDVEAADGFNFVVEQVQPVRQDGSYRKEINQPAPYAKLAGRRDLGYM